MDRTRASRISVQKRRGQREGTQLITEQLPLWENENQIREGQALRINQENGGHFLKEALASSRVSPGFLELQGLQTLKKFQDTNVSNSCYVLGTFICAS